MITTPAHTREMKGLMETSSAIIGRVGPGGNRGEFTAWDPVQGKKVWSVKESFPAWSGALATAGDVVG